jgi:uncharacterized SAM-binding protein YcdF (DUF218 family)
VRALTTDLMHLLLALPLQAVLLCLGLALAGWWRGRGQGLHRWRWWLLAGAAWVYVLSMPATANALVRWLEGRHPVPDLAALLPAPGVPADQAPTVLVLSGGWFRPTAQGYEVMLTSADWQRIETGVRLQQRLGGRLVFSGAPLPDASGSVAQRMAAMARRLGAPADAVAVETRSVNTYENLVFSTDAFHLRQARGVVLVTSALHLPRAAAVARHLGLPVTPYPCDFRGEDFDKWQLWVPSNEGAAALEGALHEVLGAAAYWWRGVR